MTAPALVLALLAAQGGSPPDPGPGVWRTVELDLEVVADELRETLDVSGTLRLVLEGGSSRGPVLAVNLEVPAQRFLAVEPPPGWAVEINMPFRGGVRLATLSSPEPLEPGAEVEIAFALEKEEASPGVQAGAGFALAGWTSVWYPAPLPPLLLTSERAREEGSTARLLSARGTTRLHLPAGWTSVSNGVRVERADSEGSVVETWRVDQPLARSFAAGPYRVARHALSMEGGGTREVAAYALTLDPAALREQAATLAAAIGALEARFGPYPYASFAIAEVPSERVSFYGSSEQGFVLATTEAFQAPGGNLPLFAHEAAHGWWGNALAGNGPGSILLDESLSQYSAVLAIEALEGPERATEFLRFSREGYVAGQCARGYFELWRDGHDAPLAELGSGGWHHQLSDAKGHWVYHMLRRRIGDERFFTTLRAFAADRARESWTVADMRAAFAAAAPQARLETFFAQWLERVGAPILEHELLRAADGAWELLVRQVQPGEPYELRLDVDVAGSDGTERRTLELRGREERFALRAGAEPPEVRLDPDHALLVWDPAYGPRPVR